MQGALKRDIYVGVLTINHLRVMPPRVVRSPIAFLLIIPCGEIASMNLKHFARMGAETFRQDEDSENGGDDLDLEASPPSLCSDKRDNPHGIPILSAGQLETKEVSCPLSLVRRDEDISITGMTRWLQYATMPAAY